MLTKIVFKLFLLNLQQNFIDPAMRKINEELLPTRIDKNIAQNVTGFLEQYAEDGILMRDIILYLCHLSINVPQQSIFEALTIDLPDFAKNFNYKVDNLQRMHTNPTHIEHLKRSRELNRYRELEKVDNKFHIFETVFENALYRLLVEPFRLPRETDYLSRSVNINENEIKTEFFSKVTLKVVPLLTSVNYYKVLGEKKRYRGTYECVLGNEFKHTLAQYFAQLSIKELVKLRQPKVDSLYIYLCSLKDTLASGSKATTELSFNYLLKQADIKIDTTSNPRLAKQKLIKKFELLRSTDLGVSLSWGYTTDARSKYIPIITFDQSDAMSPEERRDEMREYWYDRFCAEIVRIVCEQRRMRISGIDDAMLYILAFIQTQYDLLKHTTFATNGVITPLLNSYHEVFGVPSNRNYRVKIEAMADEIIRHSSIREIKAIFTDANWYEKAEKQTNQRAIKNRGFIAPK